MYPVIRGLLFSPVRDFGKSILSRDKPNIIKAWLINFFAVPQKADTNILKKVI